MIDWSKPSGEPTGGYLAMLVERNHPPAAWRDELAKIPEGKREEAAAYLRDRYRIIMHARRKLQERKQCDEGDAEIARMQAYLNMV